ncbi:hypothetical protein P8452_02685 [Trifolium repens]|nr:hypothetical protein P8452_02685 [Trifolium repens]
MCKISSYCDPNIGRCICHVELQLPELQATHKHVPAVAKGSISAFKASLVCVCFPQILLLLLPCIWLLSHLHSRLKINAKQRQ